VLTTPAITSMNPRASRSRIRLTITGFLALTIAVVLAVNAWADVEKPKPPAYYDVVAMRAAAVAQPGNWDYVSLVDDGGASFYIWENFQRAVDTCMSRRGFPDYTPAPYPIAPLNAPTGDGKTTVNPVLEASFEPAIAGVNSVFNGLSLAQKANYAQTLRGTNVYSGFDPVAEDGWNVWTNKPTGSSQACESLARSVVVDPVTESLQRVAAASSQLESLYYSNESQALQAQWSTCMRIQHGYAADDFSFTRYSLEAAVGAAKQSAPSLTTAQREQTWNELTSQQAAISASDSTCRNSVGIRAFYNTQVMPAWTRIVNSRLVDAYTSIGAAGLAAEAASGGK
jgi:hypothetical protein